MILIADAGGTKTDWCCTSRDGRISYRFKSAGFNPNYLSGEAVRNDILENLPEEVSTDDIEEVWYYGAGVTESLRESVAGVLAKVFTKAGTVFADTDLLGSARAVLGREAGFVAILGTGMNTCLFDGEKIVRKIPSFGFIMGDEGSGAYIGKKFIVDYIRGHMSEEVLREADRLIDKDYSALVEQIYRKPKPNQYCAQFFQWICDNRHKYPYCHDLLLSSFRDLFNNVVKLYPDFRKYSFNCTGSVGFYCMDVLKEAVEEEGMTLGTVIKAPMEGLIRFHTQPSD